MQEQKTQSVTSHVDALSGAAGVLAVFVITLKFYSSGIAASRSMDSGFLPRTLFLNFSMSLLFALHPPVGHDAPVGVWALAFALNTASIHALYTLQEPALCLPPLLFTVFAICLSERSRSLRPHFWWWPPLLGLWVGATAFVFFMTRLG